MFSSDETGVDCSTSQSDDENSFFGVAMIQTLMEALRQRDEQLNQKEDHLRDKQACIRELAEQLQRQGVLIREQEERLSALERRLGLNSSNSRKPPSNDR
ncbi:MAG: DUF6444 domain-containing protein [Aestuariivita sp.]|nr:DUF6444 domain-containing protein [Aestuariivita sp.]